MKLLKLLLLGVFYVLALSVSGASVSAAFDPLEQVCSGSGSGSAACQEKRTGASEENPVTSTTNNVVNLLSLVIGATAIVIIVVAGITMTLSQGDSGKIKSSRDAIIYAAVGLVVTALARTIIIFVINRTR